MNNRLNYRTTVLKHGYKKKLVTLICALLVLVLCFSMVGCVEVKTNEDEKDEEKKSSLGEIETIANDFLETQENADGEAIVELLPEEYLTYLSDEYKLDEEEVAEYLTSSLEDWNEAMEEEYDEYKLSYNYDDTDDAKNSDIKDKSKMYDEEYGFEVDDMKYVDYESVVKVRDGDDKDTNHGNASVTVIKVNGKWRLDPREVTDIIMSEYYEDKNK